MNRMMKARACRGVVIALKAEQVLSRIGNEIADKCFALYKQNAFLILDNNFIDSFSN